MRYVLAAAGLAAAIAIAIGIIVVATAGEDTLVLDLEVGECFDLALDRGASDIGTVTTVDCDEPHEAEVVAAGELDPDGTRERPSDDAVFPLVDARCADALSDAHRALLDRFGILPVVADERSWESFDGRYVCIAIPYGGGTTTGSALDP